MITKFETNGSGTSVSSGKGAPIVTIVLIGIGLYAGYRFILKPYLEKRKAEQNG
jgi:hypothetical protein